MSQTVDRKPHTPATQDAAPVVDVAALGQHLMGRWADARRQSRAFATRPDVKRIEGQSMADHRARVLEQLHLLVEERAVHKAFPKYVGGEEDAGGNIAQFEELVLADPSLQIGRASCRERV